MAYFTGFIGHHRKCYVDVLPAELHSPWAASLLVDGGPYLVTGIARILSGGALFLPKKLTTFFFSRHPQRPSKYTTTQKLS